MVIPVAVPIVGGLLAATGIGLALRKKAQDKKLNLTPQELNNQQIATRGTPQNAAALAQPLPATLLDVLNTRGAPPSQAQIDNLKVFAAQGNLDPFAILKTTDGAIIDLKSPQVTSSISDENFGGIIPTDRLTVDVARAGLFFPQIPSGNAAFKAVTVPNMNTHTVGAVSIDPRLPDSNTVVVIPQASVTGMQPDGT